MGLTSSDGVAVTRKLQVRPSSRPILSQPHDHDSNRACVGYGEAACLGAAFTASVYKSMPRKTAEWKSIVREKSKEFGYIYGSAKAITYWLNRGFNSRNPKYCNTWSASTARIS
ncbi:hypothetical protein Aph01nite_36230 [Acrocarpospora phusangensis]|uniref:Uncharacterized protein n=1 Tax=Acrocarpospora phusangensis TaxID=1070424 RepID=A0A919QAY5_9ACTN|nr:hypothetical protein [Acrocarpospora phusangensis]GIH25313.1 hypothetical protein Aph01nite_36230 [Acrocarpospora phusangensis]